MTGFDRSHIAARHARMLLIRAGLTEDEADAFMGRLSEEFSASSCSNEEERLSIVERELMKLKEKQSKTSQLATIAGSGIIGLVSGVAANAIYDVIKGAIGRGAKEISSSEDSPKPWDTIQVDWAGVQLKREVILTEPAIERALASRRLRR